MHKIERRIITIKYVRSYETKNDDINVINITNITIFIECWSELSVYAELDNMIVFDFWSCKLVIHYFYRSTDILYIYWF